DVMDRDSRFDRAVRARLGRRGCSLRPQVGRGRPRRGAGGAGVGPCGGRQWGVLWVNAAAASLNGSAILLAGGAGAGKSTVLVQLLERSWCLLADDIVTVRPHRREALPLPFNPEVRATP